MSIRYLLLEDKVLYSWKPPYASSKQRAVHFVVIYQMIALRLHCHQVLELKTSVTPTWCLHLAASHRVLAVLGTAPPVDAVNVLHPASRVDTCAHQSCDTNACPSSTFPLDVPLQTAAHNATREGHLQEEEAGI